MIFISCFAALSVRLQSCDEKHWDVVEIQEEATSPAVTQHTEDGKIKTEPEPMSL